MTRLLVLVEGDSEELFVQNILAPHLERLGVYARATGVYGGPLSQDNNAVGLSFALDFTRSGSALPRFCL